MSVSSAESTGESVADARPPVDCGLPTVGGLRENYSQETTSESTPGQRRWNADRGPRRPTGDDRLMPKITTLAADAPAVCPSCGSPAAARTIRIDHGVCVGDYRCDAGHIWETKWMVPA